MKIATLSISLFLTTIAANADVIVSVDWKNANGVSTHGSYSGVEPLAAAANPAFGASNVWNNALLGYLSPEINPSFSNLVDSNGNATNVGVQFTGVVDSYNGNDGTCPNSLFCDFIYLNSGFIDWQITGLVPNSTANFYFYNYGSPDQSYRVFNMALDTDGNGTLDGNYSVDAVTGVYAAGIVTSATGTINGEMECCLSGQASWSGFQIEETPEPATLLTLAAGMGLFRILRRRRPAQR